MLTVSILNAADHIEVFTKATRAEVFCAVLEANENDPAAYAPGNLDRLVLEAASSANVDPSSSDMPFQFALTLDGVIKKWAEDGREGAGGILYAGVFIGGGEISVCTVGDIRVHLLDSGSLVAVTRDHNQVNDPLDDPQLTPERYPHDWLSGIVTRCLGALFERPPECYKWHEGVAPSVQICSSLFHRHRDPATYVPFPVPESDPSGSRIVGPRQCIVRIDRLSSRG